MPRSAACRALTLTPSPSRCDRGAQQWPGWNCPPPAVGGRMAPESGTGGFVSSWQRSAPRNREKPREKGRNRWGRGRKRDGEKPPVTQRNHGGEGGSSGSTDGLLV